MTTSRRDFLDKKYDELFEKADTIVKKHNPCKIIDGQCSAMRKASDGLCCKTCPHISPSGCAIKSLGCKIWLCYFDSFSCPSVEIADSYWEDMISILKEAEKYKLSFPRAGKEVTIDAAIKGTHRGCRGSWDHRGPLYPHRYDPACKDYTHMKFITDED